MIQLNLLPDIKQQFIRTRRTKRMVITVAGAIAAAALAVMVLLFMTTNLVQSKRISDLSKDIDTSVADLKSRTEVAKILTVQNQLNVITSLHDSKPDFEKMFVYLPKAVPQGVTITDFNFDFVGSTFTIEGTTLTLDLFNKLVDSIKFTEISPLSDTVPANLSGKVFSNIIFTTSRDKEAVTYKINGTFEPLVFLESEQTVQLTVPNIISTRSTLENPGSIFADSNLDNQGGSN